jgi:1-acyl-sn-glycerol-3-phosphate acyltransferase
LVLRERTNSLLRKSILLGLIHDLNEHLGSIPLPLKIIVYTLLSVPGTRLAANLRKFDSLIKKQSLKSAAEWLLKKYGVGKELKGHPIPSSGPVLVVCNHPGLFDGTALCSSITRSDVEIVASGTAFFTALTNLCKYLVMVHPDPKMRVQATLSMLRTLRNGRMLVLFGRGSDDEPDPMFTDGSHDILRAWPATVGTLALCAEEEGFQFSILPVLISNVFTERSQKHPLVMKMPEGEIRKAVSRLHVLLRGENGQKLKINVGKAIDSSQLAKMSKDPDRLSEIVRDHLRRLRGPRINKNQQGKGS